MNETKELAEKILLALVSNSNFAPTDSDSDTAAACWDLAEAMQAQAEQRRAPEPDLCNHDWRPIYAFNVQCNEVCSLCGALRVDW